LTSSDSDTTHVKTKKMPPHAKNVAYVEQDIPSKPPVLHPGDITLEVMREFEDGCVGYFETKEIAEDKQVRKILLGLPDSRVKDWVATERNHITGLTFPTFMAEFRTAYLKDDWEETVHRELGSMTQGSDSFWDYAIQVQAKNSLLIATTSHLDESKLRHRLEAGMEDLLARRCANAKINKTVSLKAWLGEVKRADDMMRAERKEFEAIAKAHCDTNRKAYPLGEPSNHANVSAVSSCGGGRAGGSRGTNRLPKLTEAERQLLFNNEGCLKCRRFFVDHRSTNCPNNFPSGQNYRALTQADADRYKPSRQARMAAVVDVNENDEPGQQTIHPVAAVMGVGHPVAYMPTNVSSIIETASDKESDDMVSVTVPLLAVVAVTG
jgi:hypothetical protein